MYWRKLVFFASVFAFAFLSWQSLSYYKADIDTFSPSEYGGNLSIVVNVEPDGSIFIDGKKSKEKVSQIENGQEIRFPILDNAGQYYDLVDVVLTLPKDVASEGTFEMKGIHGVLSLSATVQDERTVVYEASGVDSTATLSIVAGLPEGTVKFPPVVKVLAMLGTVKSAVWITIGVLIPVVALIFMFLFIYYQFRRQRVDEPPTESKGPPMTLPPAVVGVLYHQKVGSREIAATLIDLAFRGEIYIVDRERDFAFAKNKKEKSSLSGFEKILLSKIFKEGKTISSQEEIEHRVANHLYSRKLSLVVASVYLLATRLGYFKINPQKFHRKFQVIGICGFFVGLAGFILSLKIFTDPPYIAFFWVGMMAATLVITISARNLPIRSVLGQEALSNWLAFKKYLSAKEKIPFAYDNQEIFQKYLPYAVVMNCEVSWAKRFTRQNFILPAWFISDRAGLSLQDFCFSLFPIISFISRSFTSIIEPGYE